MPGESPGCPGNPDAMTPAPRIWATPQSNAPEGGPPGAFELPSLSGYLGVALML